MLRRKPGAREPAIRDISVDPAEDVGLESTYSVAMNTHSTSPKQRWRRLQTRLSRILTAPLGLLVAIVALVLCLNLGLHNAVLRRSRPRATRNYPRYLVYDEYTNDVEIISFPYAKIKELAYSEEQLKKVNWGPSSRDDDGPEVDADGCIPMHSWMTHYSANCNLMHEVDMFPRSDSFLFINCGGSRCAFRVRDTLDDTQVVIKTTKFDKTSSHKPGRHQKARRDALATERLTASPYVADIFGSCGLSQLVEYSNGGSLYDLIKVAWLKGDDVMPPVDNLRIGVQVSTAVADMHTCEEDNVTSLVHQDLCCHQFLLVDGVFKLNDFHMGVFMRKRKDTGEVCPEQRVGHNSNFDRVRAPDELDSDTRGYTDLSKVDTYMMGNILFYVLTKKWIMPDYPNDKARNRLKKGLRSDFPSRILESTDPAEQAMVETIRLCWTHDPKERPTAREISDKLKAALYDITGEKDDVVRVIVPPLPEDHIYSEKTHLHLGWDD